MSDKLVVPGSGPVEFLRRIRKAVSDTTCSRTSLILILSRSDLSKTSSATAAFPAVFGFLDFLCGNSYYRALMLRRPLSCQTPG